jgi:hypothetical protein
MYIFRADERPERECFPNQHAIYIGATELQFLIDDVEQCSFEYHISQEYQEFARKFIAEATRIVESGM